ncbi:MAG: homocysteine S-methyltransferase family protein [SAR202 cluster bacterium]|nr:homocysteine S-methyltransferase family protein [SAR202 cluster bacterium]
MTKSLTILDGSMGDELHRRRPPDVNDPAGLFSARALINSPELVTEVHKDYIDAGADIITTNTYSTIPSYLSRAGLENSYLQYTALAGQIACSSAMDARSTVLVAGSIPPLDESYRHDLVPHASDALPVYRNMVATLFDYVDLFICETMSSGVEAKNAMTAVREISGRSKPVWVSWTLSEHPGQGLRSGESIKEAYQAIESLDADAFLFNCTVPKAITRGLKELTRLTKKPIGGYPNRDSVPEGWTIENDKEIKRYDLPPEGFKEYADNWRDIGATIIGGCCGIGPEHIDKLTKSLESGHD